MSYYGITHVELNNKVVVLDRVEAIDDDLERFRSTPAGRVPLLSAEAARHLRHERSALQDQLRRRFALPSTATPADIRSAIEAQRGNAH